MSDEAAAHTGRAPGRRRARLWRVIRAGSAGLVGLAFIWAAVVAVVFTDPISIPGGGRFGLADDVVTWLVLASAAAVGGALPLRVLRIPWRWALLAALLAHVIAVSLPATLDELGIGIPPPV